MVPVFLIGEPGAIRPQPFNPNNMNIENIDKIDKKARTVILGLDGLSWTLARRLADEGIMPRLAELIRISTAGPMNSVRPEISPAAWTSFFTAGNPGSHGIYGFTDFRPGEYDLVFNSSAEIRTPCLWDWLGLTGRRSVVLNVPMTYPARPLSGIMVSGFVALDLNRAVYPQAAADYLRGIDYRLEADFERVHQDRDIFLADLDRALAGRGLLLDRFWPEDWSLFFLVVTDTDRLFHFFLREYLDGGGISDYFHDFFQRVDQLIGQVHDRTADLEGEGIRLILLSDHGFAPVKQEFHLNRWLAARGCLPGVGPEAAALALDPTRIYFNRPPRFRAGRLSRLEVERLTGELTTALSREPAVAGVDRGGDLYRGPRAALAPDLVVRPNPGYEFKAKFNAGEVYTESPLMGTHTYEDAFFLVHDRTGSGEELEIADIIDLGKFVFNGFGLKAPETEQSPLTL